MKPKYLNPFYWLMRFIQINREIAAAIPAVTEDDLESLRKFSEHLNKRAERLDKMNHQRPPSRMAEVAQETLDYSDQKDHLSKEETPLVPARCWP